MRIWLCIHSHRLLGYIVSKYPQRNTSFLFKKINLFIYFWLCWVLIAGRGLSLVAGSGGLLFIAVCGLLVAVVSLVAEHGL